MIHPPKNLPIKSEPKNLRSYFEIGWLLHFALLLMCCLAQITSNHNLFWMIVVDVIAVTVSIPAFDRWLHSELITCQSSMGLIEVVYCEAGYLIWQQTMLSVDRLQTRFARPKSSTL